MHSGTKRVILLALLAFLLAVVGVAVQYGVSLEWPVAGCGPLASPKSDGCKTTWRIIALAVMFGLKGWVDYFELAHPLRRMSKIQKRYVDQNLSPLVEAYRKRLKTKALRVNIMVPRLSPWGRVFDFLHPDGFKPPHDGDRGILLRTFQGVAGEALHSTVRSPVYWYFDDEWNAARKLQAPMRHPPVSEYLPFLRQWWTETPWGLTRKQARRTGHVKWILSAQMFRESDDPKKPDEIRGVINIDITDAAVAKSLAGRPNLIRELSEELVKVGKICAELW